MIVAGKARWAVALALWPLSSLTGALPHAWLAPPANHRVEMSGLAYHPSVLELAAGDTVTWFNRDIVPHTATSANPARDRIDTGSLAAGDSGRYVATRAGVFSYTCTFHPTMQGRLVVRAPAPSGDQKHQ